MDKDTGTMSARIGFVQARERLAAKQESSLCAKQAGSKEKQNKKTFTIGKLLRSMSPKSKATDSSYEHGARVASQERQQERAATDPRNQGGRLTPGVVYTPQEPQKKKRVEEWLDHIDDSAKRGFEEDSCRRKPIVLIPIVKTLLTDLAGSA